MTGTICMLYMCRDMDRLLSCLPKRNLELRRFDGLFSTQCRLACRRSDFKSVEVQFKGVTIRKICLTGRYSVTSSNAPGMFGQKSDAASPLMGHRQAWKKGHSGHRVWIGLETKPQTVGRSRRN